MLKRNSLKTQLLLMNIIVLILPMLLFGYFSQSLFSQYIYNNVKYFNSTLELNISKQIETQMEEPIRVMRQIGGVLSKKELVNPVSINSYLDSIRSIYPFFETLEILNDNGTVEHIAPFEEDHIGISMKYEEFFKAVDKRGKPVWSSIFLSQRTGEPTVTISMYCGKKLLVGYLHLSEIIKMIEDIKLQNGSYISLVDEREIFIADPDKNNVEERMRYPYFDELMKNLKPEATSTFTDSNSGRIVYASKIKSTGWYAVITMNASRLLSPVKRLDMLISVGFLCLLIVSITLSINRIGRIMKELRILLHKTQNVSSGDYCYASIYGGYSEFNELSRHFDIMTENILVRENKIQAFNTELERKVIERTDQLEQANIALTEEILERQRVEDRIKKLNCELEDRILERTEALRNANEELQATNAVLEEDIQERMRIENELIIAREAAEAANEAKSTFLANMSHEIRTPMNGIIGMTELMLMTEPSLEQQEYLNLTMSSSKSLLRIINDILDYSKIEAGKIVIEHEAFNLVKVLHEVILFFETIAQNKNIQMMTILDPSIPETVFGDAIRIRQILTNLAGNAIKFTKNGEVTVKVELEKASRGFIQLAFCVKDCGIGIPADKQAQIFERFKQLDSSYGKSYQGTGLGLAIAKNLVELMGGKIWFNSIEGKGSEFYFTIVLGTEDKAVIR